MAKYVPPVRVSHLEKVIADFVRGWGGGAIQLRIETNGFVMVHILEYPIQLQRGCTFYNASDMYLFKDMSGYGVESFSEEKMVIRKGELRISLTRL